MGKRDFSRREPKKQRKDVKKTEASVILPPLMTVEIIKKGKKNKEDETP
ncbi:hypothetical protein ACFLT8_03470 [Chloroflexota bacterium]